MFSNAERAGRLPEPVQSTETGFNSFLTENTELLEELESSTRELRNEDRGRRKDPVLDEFVSETMALIKRNGQVSFRVKPDEFKRLFIASIFDENPESSSLSSHALYGDVVIQKAGITSSEEDRIVNKFDEYADEYHEVIAPLRDARNQARQSVHKEFVEYLLNSPENMGHFGDFLMDPSRKQDRENVRAFLQFLAEKVHKNKPLTYLDQAVDIWKEGFVNNPNPDILRRFIRDRLTPETGERDGGDIFLSGMRFGIEVSRSSLDAGDEFSQQSEEDVLLNFLSANEWPGEVRSRYNRYIANEYLQEVSRVGAGLYTYRQTGDTVASADEIFRALETNKRRKKRSGKQREMTLEKNGTDSQEGGSEYKVAMSKVHSDQFSYTSAVLEDYTQEDLKAWLVKRAGKIAPHDGRMAKDLENMIENLRRNPYGFGTRKMMGEVLRVGHQIYSLRRLAPDRRGVGLPLSHELSRDLRVTYAVDDKSKLFILEGIYTHPEFEEKFRKNL